MKRSVQAAAGIAAAGLLAGIAGPALAQHRTVYDARTDAFASSQAHQGPNVVGSTSQVVNGTATPSNPQPGPGGTIDGGGSVARSWVQVTQPGGFGGQSFGNAAYAAADLAAGRLKATTESYGPEFFGSPLGFASARLDDTIFFTNTSGTTQTISFTYTFNGQMQNPFGSNPGGYVSLGLSCGGNISACHNGSNGTGEAITFATSDGTPVSLYGGPRTPEDNWNYYFNADSSCFGENIFCGQYATSLWEYGLNEPNAGGVVDGYIRAYLNIPTGQTALGVRGTLNLDCRAASSCDFGHTGLLGFGALPDGLTFGSASGVFLTSLAGGVPEPATWALLILGFGATGAALRRRRTVRVAFA